MSEAKRPTSTASPEAFWLTGVAGCVDAVGFVTFAGLFVAHMSGNSAALGAWFGQGFWEKGLPHLLAVPVFVLGVLSGYLLMGQTRSERRSALILGLEATLLTAFGIGYALNGRPDFASPAYFGLAVLLLLAMGMQNATLREVGRSGFPSTYVTGILDALARATARWITARRAGKTAPEDLATLCTAGSLWAAYIIGATLGSVGLLFFGAAILVLPVLILLATIRNLVQSASVLR